MSLLPSVEITGVPPLLVLLTVVLGLNLCPLAIKASSLPTQRLVFLSSEQMVLCENKIKATQKQQKKKRKKKKSPLVHVSQPIKGPYYYNIFKEKHGENMDNSNLARNF